MLQFEKKRHLKLENLFLARVISFSLPPGMGSSSSKFSSHNLYFTLNINYIFFYLLRNLTGKTSERVAVLVSGPGLEKPKLLGIPAVIDSKGETQNVAVVKLLK